MMVGVRFDYVGLWMSKLMSVLIRNLHNSRSLSLLSCPHYVVTQAVGNGMTR